MFRIILIALLITPSIVNAQVKRTYSGKDTIKVNDETTGKQQIFMYVERMPEPTFNVYEYLGKNIKYPQAAVDSNIEGRAIVKFVVDTLGNIIDVVAAKPLHPLLDAEAIRVVKSMTKWKPGTQNGRPVMVYYTLPISFKLSDDEEK